MAFPLLLTGCFDDTGTELESYVTCNFDPEGSGTSLDTYMNQYFKGGKDSVYVSETYYYTPMAFHATLSGDGTLKGGFALCIGAKEDVSEEAEPSRFATLSGGCSGTLGYAVFRQSDDMPLSPVEFFRPNMDSYILAAAFMANITHAARCAAKYGTGLSGGPFDGDDYLTLTVTGYDENGETGKVTTALISGKKPIEDWTNVSINTLGKVTALSFRLDCSRADFPMDFCLDNLLVDYYQKY